MIKNIGLMGMLTFLGVAGTVRFEIIAQEPPKSKSKESAVPRANKNPTTSPFEMQTEKGATKPVARPNPRISFGRVQPNQLLEKPAVQKELKLTDSQSRQLKAVLERGNKMFKENGEQLTSALKELGETPDPEQAAALRQQRVVELRELSNGLDAAVMKVLDRDQRKRLYEIRLQAEGPVAFLDPDLQERLRLSPEQIERITEVVQQGRVQLREVSDRTQATIADSQLPKTDEPQAEQGKTKPEPEAGKRPPDKKVDPKSDLAKEAVPPAAKREVFKVDPAKRAARDAALKKLAKEAEDTHHSVIQGIEGLLAKFQREKYRQLLGKPFSMVSP